MLSGGPAGAPRRPRPGRWVALALAVAILAGVGYAVARRGELPATPAAALPAASPDWSPPPGPPARLDGPPGSGPPGLRLLVGGPQLLAVDAAGRVARVARLPLGAAAVGDLVAVPDGVLAVAVALQLPQTARVYLIRPTGPPLAVARADEVVPAGQHTFYGLRYPLRQGAPALLYGFSTSGEKLFQREVPGGWHLAANTPGGLLVSAYPAGVGPAAVLLVEPRTGRTLRRLGTTQFVLAASAERVAWVAAGCQLGVAACPIVVTDLRTGRSRTYPPVGEQVGFGLFSPDGRWLALSAYGFHPFVQPNRPGYVAVLDLRTGAATRLPGVETSAKQAADLAWTPDSRYLAIAVRWPDQGYERLGVWSVAEQRLTALPGRLPVGSPPTALLAQ